MRRLDAALALANVNWRRGGREKEKNVHRRPATSLSRLDARSTQQNSRTDATVYTLVEKNASLCTL